MGVESGDDYNPLHVAGWMVLGVLAFFGAMSAFGAGPFAWWLVFGMAATLAVTAVVVLDRRHRP